MKVLKHMKIHLSKLVKHLGDTDVLKTKQDMKNNIELVKTVDDLTDVAVSIKDSLEHKLDLLFKYLDLYSEANKYTLEHKEVIRNGNYQVKDENSLEYEKRYQLNEPTKKEDFFKGGR